jgi:predicted glutamate--cysteine ligase
MRNVRHLWCSVRPNGDNRPYHLNRLELRICDLVLNPIHLLAITALLESRLWQVLEDDSLDPLVQSTIAPTNLNTELVKLTLENEQATARHSLKAVLTHWQDGRTIIAQDWIKELAEAGLPIAKQRGFACFLTPIFKLIREGNEAQKWLKQYRQGASIREIIQMAIKTTWLEEQELEDKLCQYVIAA